MVENIVGICADRICAQATKCFSPQLAAFDIVEATNPSEIEVSRIFHEYEVAAHHATI